MPLHKSKLSKERRTISTLVVLTLIFITTFLFLWAGKGFNVAYTGFSYVSSFYAYFDTDQYAYLGDALIHGRLNLDLPVPDGLAQLSHPYSPVARQGIANNGDNPIFFDHAFYKGKYYCYFGVVPAIMFFVPYQLITGSWLNTSISVAIAGVLAILAMSFLAYELSHRFKKTATPASTGMVFACLFIGSGLLCLGAKPRFYELPMITSIMLTSLGLAFWLKARKECIVYGETSFKSKQLANANSNYPKYYLSKPCMFFGTFFLCLNLGSRPQFVLSCLLAFPIFYNEIKNERILFSSKSISTTIVSLLPILLIFPPLLWYNYARFDSIFDFGSTYNLTSYDLTTYKQRWILTAYLAYCALIRLPQFSTSFPFLNYLETDYQFLKDEDPTTFAPAEPMYGGYAWLVCVAWLIVLVPYVFRILKRRHLAGFCVSSFIISVIILIYGIKFGGISQRYMCDFALFVQLIVCVVILSLQEKFAYEAALKAQTSSLSTFLSMQEDCIVNNRKWKRTKKIITVMIVASGILFTASLFSPTQIDSFNSYAADWFGSIIPWIWY